MASPLRSRRTRITRPRVPQWSHAPSAISRSSRRLKPNVAIATKWPGRASADAMHGEQIEPSAAETTSQIRGHNVVTIATRHYRYGNATTTLNSSTYPLLSTANGGHIPVRFTKRQTRDFSDPARSSDPAIHRISQPALHKFGVRHLDVQNRLWAKNAFAVRRPSPHSTAPRNNRWRPRRSPTRMPANEDGIPRSRAACRAPRTSEWRFEGHAVLGRRSLMAEVTHPWSQPMRGSTARASQGGPPGS